MESMATDDSAAQEARARADEATRRAEEALAALAAVQAQVSGRDGAVEGPRTGCASSQDSVCWLQAQVGGREAAYMQVPPPQMRHGASSDRCVMR